MARVPTSASLGAPRLSGGRAVRSVPTMDVPGNFQVPVPDLPDRINAPQVNIPTPNLPNSVGVSNDVNIPGLDVPKTLYTGADRAALAGPGRALADFGGTISSEANQWGTYLRGLETGKAKVAAAKGLTQLDAEVAADPDYTTHEGRYLQGAAKVKADAMSHITTAQEAQSFSDAFDLDVLQSQTRIKKQSQERDADKGRAELTTLLKTTRDQLSNPGLTEERRQQLIETADEAVNNLKALGYVDEENALNLRSGFKKDVALDDQSQKIADGKYDQVREDLDGGKALANLRKAPADVQQGLTMAAEASGVAATWLAEIANAESGFNPAAKNPNSSATGLYQFTDATWISALRKSEKVLKERYGVTQDFSKFTKEQMLAMRADPVLQSVVMGEFTFNNITALEEKLGGQHIGLKDAYLAHVMGVDGAAKLIRAMEVNPNAPAEVLFAKEAKANPALFAGKSMAEAYATITGKVGDGKASFAYENLDGPTRLSLKNRADSEEYQGRTRRNAEDQVKKAKLESLMKDDASSIEETGVGVDNLDPTDISEILGPEKATEHAQKREIALEKHEAKQGMESLPDEQLLARVEALDPRKTGDAVGYAARQEVYDAARKRSDEIIKKRETDPAAAVEETPEVQMVLAEADQAAAAAEGTDAQGVSLGSPQQVGRIARARMDAQARIGIPEGQRSPVTRKEAKALMSRLAGLDTGGTKSAWSDIVNETEATYGPEMAKKVLASAIGYEIGDRDQAELVTGLLNKAVKSGRFTSQDFAPFMQLEELRQANGFMNPSPEFAAQSQVPPADGLLRAGGPGPRVNPPKVAVDHLKSNPDLLDAFSRKYGIPADEARKRYLGN